MPVGQLTLQSEEVDPLLKKVRNTLKVTFNRDELLNNFDSWGSQLSAEIRKLPSQFEIFPHVTEISVEMQKVKYVKDNVSKRGYGPSFIEPYYLPILNNTIRSSLALYLVSLRKAETVYSSSFFDKKIEQVNKLVNEEVLKKAKNDLFNKYYSQSSNKTERKKFEIFMSYSTLDKVLAGKIRELLTKEGVEVFLAHHDIEISKNGEKRY